MKYRLVAVDMDGTLLNPDKEISPRTELTVKRAAEAGVYVCLSTGRPLCGVRRHLERLALTAPVITCNGAAIIDPASGKNIYTRSLTSEAAREIWNLGHSFGTTMCLWIANRLYVSEMNDRTEDYKKISGVEPETVTDFDALASEGISKILWYDTEQRIEDFRLRMDSQGKGNGRYTYVTSNPRFLEFVDSAVSKAAALQKLGEYLSIPREQTVAIGDGENDLSMLRYAGLGVAMANASESVQSQCDYVTASNSDDGAAQAIERFCL